MGTLDKFKLNEELEKKYISVKKEKYLNNLLELKNKGLITSTPVGHNFAKLLLKNSMQYKDKIINYNKYSLQGKRRIAYSYIKEYEEYIEVFFKITIDTIINNIFKQNTPTYMNVLSKVGDLLRVELALIKIKENEPKLYNYYKQKWIKMPYQTLSKVILENSKHLINIDDEEKRYLSSFFVDLVLEVNEDFFIIKNIRRKKGHTKKIVTFSNKGTEITLKILKNIKNIISETTPVMLTEPKPVSPELNTAGFYHLNYSLVIGSNSYVPLKMQHIINKVSKQEWKVNNKVYKVINQIVDNKIISKLGGELTQRLVGDLPLPDVVEPKSIQQLGLDEKRDFKKYADYIEALKEWEGRIKGRRFMMFEALRQIKELQDLTKEEEPTVFFPHNIDYRGRVYNIPTYLSFMRESWIKALFKLPKKEKLTKQGWYWFKIHIANMYGLDKKPFEERIKWVENNEKFILDIANNPLDTVYDWEQADEPYLFLASCFAYKEAKETNMTDLPIQLDATCSGIQMYSGLLRDKKGAEVVNVIGNERKDIYQDVADVVNRKLKDGDYPEYFEYKDSEGNPVKYHNKKLAEQIAGKVTRKIVKRPVMTLPYSVTPRGMYEQIADEIHDLLLDGKEFWNKNEFEKWQVTKLIQVVTKNAIEEVVEGAVVGQKIIKDITKNYLKKNLNKPIIWTNNYGFDIKMWRPKEVIKRIYTHYGRTSYYIKKNEQNKMKVLNAIAPNFIHSIDSQVLYGVVERCDFSFGIIHDCFLSHPNYGDDLQKNYKESFIEVMESNPLQKFADDLGYKEEIELINTLDLKEIHNSKYIIS